MKEKRQLKKKDEKRSDLVTMAKQCVMVFLVVFGVLVSASFGWAAKAYVTDSFRISLRRGPTIENKILRFIPSGLPVKINETQDGWSRVRVLEVEGEEGILEGWVLSRYLVKRLPWEDQAKQLKAENTKLKADLAVVDKKWAATVAREKNMNKELKENYQAVKNKAELLAEENETLRSERRNKWFTAGGLVLFSGLLVGLLVGSPQKKRRLSF